VVTARTPADAFDLLDWKRRVFGLYAEVRAGGDGRAGWDRWREVRHDLITSHPQSPIPEGDRERHPGPVYFEYDPQARVLADVETAEPETVVIEGSAEGRFEATRFGRAGFELAGAEQSLSLYWLEGYGGGVFVSFRDATSGRESYGACRYLLDTVKGADLGMEDGLLVLDFNFAYNPSCAYDPRWVCPLAPPDNRLALPIRAGERTPPKT
jgi:uncharacterized protein (DUF1684 family)